VKEMYDMCMRRWHVLGGWATLREQESAYRVIRQRKMVQLQRTAMRRFRSTGTLTGRPQRRQPTWHHEFDDRRKRRFSRAGWQQRLDKRQRERQITGGHESFGAGKWWVVEELLDVRKVRRKTEWLVQWAGCDASGERLHANDWCGRSVFNKTLGKEAVALERFVYPKRLCTQGPASIRKRGRMADISAEREGWRRVRRGWMVLPVELEPEVVDAEAGTEMDTGNGGYRKSRIVGGKWRRAARKTWVVSDSSEAEET
jgi:hypothetical protein